MSDNTQPPSDKGPRCTCAMGNSVGVLTCPVHRDVGVSPRDKGPVREWWIDLNHSCQMGDFNLSESKEEADKHGCPPLVHVIEYSAYSRILSAYNRVEGELEAMRKERDLAFARVLQLELDKAELKALARELVGVLEYQKTALRKICEGSMFTPESERKVAEDKIENVITRAKSMGVLND